MKFVKDYLDNRELSWLKFNERVLEEAEDESVPLFERLRFVSIFCSNLDEFFMIRVGSLRDQTLLKNAQPDNKTNLTASEQLSLIDERVSELMPRKDAAYFNILKTLSEKGIIRQVNANEISADEEKYLLDYFKKDILPLLSPSVIDKKHPVQFLKNKDSYICALLKKKDSEKNNTVVGVIPVWGSDVWKRVVFLPSENNNEQILRFILAESIVMRFIDIALTNYTVEKKFVFRITRNADIDVDEALYDHDVDFRDVMEELIKKRKKLAPVRIELNTVLDEDELDKVISKLNLQEHGFDDGFVYLERTPFDLNFISELEEKLKEHHEIFSEKLSPQQSCMVNPHEKIFKQIDKGDILLSYPYESIKPFIRLLEEAAFDENVVSIKITLYRVARQSKIVNALIIAAEKGKDVLALVELRARFDEENNIGWSKRLAESGVKVIYGLDGMKVHSKLLLITKKTGQSFKYYTQIGTGNYNERTAQLYTDYTLMTSDRDIGTDAFVIFNALATGNTVEYANELLVAPKTLKPRVIEMIENEMKYKSNGYIGLKLNSLTDKRIIEKLVEAGQQGVKIELLIRGICCLITGIPEKTDNITVTSVVGRFLEHSRVYIFGKGERQKVYISSADFMTRNTERRVEVAARIRDERLRRCITGEFNQMLTDNIKARDQNSDGIYIKRGANAYNKTDKQLYFYRAAYERAFEAANIRENDKKTFMSVIKAFFKFIRKKFE